MLQPGGRVPHYDQQQFRRIISITIFVCVLVLQGESIAVFAASNSSRAATGVINYFAYKALANQPSGCAVCCVEPAC